MGTWFRGSGWRVVISKVFMVAEVAEVSRNLCCRRDRMGCRIVTVKAGEVVPDWPFVVMVTLFHTTACHLHGI